MTRPLVLALLAALTISSSVAARLPDADDEARRAIELLDRLAAARLTIDWPDRPLVVAIEELSQALPVPLAADFLSLERLGIGPTDPLDLRLRDASGLAVLGAIAGQLGDAWERPRFEVAGGRLVLTTIEGARALRHLVVYDVRDLLAAGVADALARELAVGAPGEDAAGAAQEGAMEGGGAGEAQDDDAEAEGDGMMPLTPGRALILLLIEHVDPDVWLEVGAGLAKITDRSGVLIVTAPATTHRMLRDALARLRRAEAATIGVHASIVDLPRATWERIVDRAQPDDPRLVDRVRAAEGRLRWKSAASAALGTESRFEAQDEAIEVLLEITPTRDAARETTRAAVRVRCVEGSDRREVAATVTLPPGFGGAVLELPAATPGAEVRLLLLAPTAG